MSNQKTYPKHFYFGISLVLISWILNWSLEGLRSHLGFFPLWLGYGITIDALVYKRKGNSLITRNYISYFKLFIVSAPIWWLFELFNSVTRNWYYDGRQFFTDFEYTVYATLSFSTVIPAVFGSAELFSTFSWIKKFSEYKKINPVETFIKFMFVAGILLLVLLLVFPGYFYILLWLSIYFIVEPINYKFKNRTILDSLNRGNWIPILSLCFGCLVCGFFWEFWNYYSYPKWIYRVPHLEFLKIFEMPIVGYLGYIPFSLELFALYSLLSPIIGENPKSDYIQLS